jgi:hypothetical protein
LKNAVVAELAPRADRPPLRVLVAGSKRVKITVQRY